MYEEAVSFLICNITQQNELVLYLEVDCSPQFNAPPALEEDVSTVDVSCEVPSYATVG